MFRYLCGISVLMGRLAMKAQSVEGHHPVSPRAISTVSLGQFKAPHGIRNNLGSMVGGGPTYVGCSRPGGAPWLT